MSTGLSERALPFLEEAFDTRALAGEYPLVFDGRFEGETVEIAERGAIRAACAILVRDFRCGSQSVRGGLIGSVATHPEQRRRGFATQLLREAEDALRARGCMFALLWADDPDFYIGRGYVPFGCEHDYLLVSELRAALPPSTGVRELGALDVPHLHRLYERHPSRVRRTLGEMQALLAVPGMVTLVRERAARPTHPALPVAYACLGRGRDLRDAIHDWAGEPEDVLALLSAHLEQRFPAGGEGALVLMAPPSAVELGYLLTRLGAVRRAGILGLGKLLEPSSAAQCLDSVLRTGSRAGSATWNGRELELAGPRGRTRLDEAGMSALLFGGPEVEEAARSLVERLGWTRPRLPLELFAFGLDSI